MSKVLTQTLIQLAHAHQLQAGVAVVNRFQRALVLAFPLTPRFREVHLPGRLRLALPLITQSNTLLRSLASHLKDQGYKTEIQTVLSLLGEARPLATQAGLGERGKNNLVLTPQAGPRVLFAAVLTTAPLEPNPPSPQLCTGCEACFKACPSRALSDAGLNYTRCLPYALRGCLNCAFACPIGQDHANLPLEDGAIAKHGFSPDH